MKSVTFPAAALAGLVFVSLPAAAQDPPLYVPRDLDREPLFLNQFTTPEALPPYANRCSGPAVGAPYIYVDVGDVLPWDLEEDPGTAFYAADLCGLRTRNLSGVWQSIWSTTRYVVSHDPRTGSFEIRNLYIAPDVEPRKTWEVRFGDKYAAGKFHAAELWLDVYGTFPPEWKVRCPDQAVTIKPAASLGLGYDQEGRFELSFYWPRLRIQNECSVEFMEMNSQQIYRLDLEP